MLLLVVLLFMIVVRMLVVLLRFELCILALMFLLLSHQSTLIHFGRI